ncbi:ABC transporter ATP-binding protein [Kibdelosporangium persicum]|uniref:Putrescine transport ATP-binding protein PotA n=1 Tax=Kibdelosporangium persicum TaxID=2698649 RepID=A0ABX2FB14_9PSEU|nr:ABC transporter ATP-binding protein [Kibdelosporangium persicum]NRN67950.1 Putrescine transport ATP-binding protein PotA [Kibdelosporangium persicum]
MTLMAQDPATRPAAGDETPVVRITGLGKAFRRADGSVAKAIDDVSLDVRPGEFLVLLGPSGCGKTTLLRTIAGLERADTGSVALRGVEVFSAERGIDLPPERRRLSMIFQSYALWPHMTAFDNIAYPLRNARPRPDRATVEKRVQAALEMVGTPELARQYPNQMSGGQQQRIALARAIVGGDDLVLFDEPLSNVDAKVREQLRLELLALQRELGFAAVYVTHDQTEAMELAHRIAVMGDGRVRQLADPATVYRRPVSRYVANFVGTANELVGTVVRHGEGTTTLRTGLGEVTGVRAGLAVGDEAVAVFRPERTRLGADATSGNGNTWPAEVAAVLFLGAQTETVVKAGAHSFRLLGEHDVAEGEQTTVTVREADVLILPADG